MVAALELYFDMTASLRVRKLWTALEAADVRSLGGHTHGRHRPHVSLVAADQLDSAAIKDALAGLTVPPRDEPIVLTFQYVAQFPGGVLWLGPAPSPALLALHDRVTERLDSAGVGYWDLYRPATWVPHCTLSMMARGEAITRAVPLCFDILPVTATLTAAAVVDHNRDIFQPL